MFSWKLRETTVLIEILTVKMCLEGFREEQKFSHILD